MSTHVQSQDALIHNFILLHLGIFVQESNLFGKSREREQAFNLQYLALFNSEVTKEGRRTGKEAK